MKSEAWVRPSPFVEHGSGTGIARRCPVRRAPFAHPFPRGLPTGPWSLLLGPVGGGFTGCLPPPALGSAGAVGSRWLWTAWTCLTVGLFLLVLPTCIGLGSLLFDRVRAGVHRSPGEPAGGLSVGCVHTYDYVCVCFPLPQPLGWVEVGSPGSPGLLTDWLFQCPSWCYMFFCVPPRATGHSWHRSVRALPTGTLRFTYLGYCGLAGKTDSSPLRVSLCFLVKV